MTSRTIVCSECGEAVPYGRLSCPACGALLASVAGGHRAPGATSDQPSTSTGEDPSTLADDEATDPLTAAVDDVRPVGAGAYVPPGASLPTAGGPTAPRPAPSVLTPVSVPASTSSTYAAAAAASAAAANAAATATTAGAPDRAPGTVRSSWSARVGARLASLDGLDSGLEQAAIVGAALVAFGLLLPWSRSVIGATGVSSYFDTWGLAGPAHALVFIAAIVVVLLAALPNPIPAWIRTGLPALGLGSFVLGLLWPYAIGPLGAGLGSLVAFIGSLILIIVGILVVGRGRHDRAGPDV